MPDKLRYRRFGTPGAVPTERFDWRTWCSGTVDAPARLDRVEAAPRDLQASTEVLSVGDISIVEVRCGPARGRWRGEGTEAGNMLRVDILHRVPGMTGCWHNCDSTVGESTVLLGRLAGWCPARAGLRSIQVNVPRRLLPVADAAIDRVTDLQLPPDLPLFETLVRPLLLGMVGRLEDLSRSATADLGTVWLALVTMLVRSLDGESTDGEELAPARRLRAQRFIAANLADPSLDPDAVAAAVHMSRRSLYQLFARDGEGVAASIRRQRLERARAMLLDPAYRRRPIAEVAAEVGLLSAAHFSRLFRAEYGESPRDARAHATRASAYPQRLHAPQMASPGGP